MLPSFVTLTSHPRTFFITYSFPVISFLSSCLVCHQKLLYTHNAIYFCPKTVQFAHVTCAIRRMKSVPQTGLELIQLPDNELDMFRSLEICRYSQTNQSVTADDELAIEKFHEHPLILVDDEGINAPHNKLVCDICTQTINISSPFYRCTQGGCHFLAHKVCADAILFNKFKFPGGLTGELCPDPTKWFFNAIFYCFSCRLPCNGPCYYTPSSKFYGIPEMFDVLCMAAPSIIKHTSHSQHFLYRTVRFSRASPISCCSRDSTDFDVYKCIICDFFIHVRCAFLPKRISHRFDQHPLHLITTTSGASDENDICEICENGVDHRIWFYRCATCDYSFHINCIPSLGYLSKVKFGGELSIPSHSHPLTLTRMLLVGRNEKCGFCSQIIQGLVDQMAFSCSEGCGFWIHFRCARDSCGSKSRVFEEIDEEALCNAYKIED